MLEVLASAFFDELFSLEMEKYALDLTPDQFDRITGAVGKRWAAAGIDPGNISSGMATLRAQLDEVANTSVERASRVSKVIAALSPFSADRQNFTKI